MYRVYKGYETISLKTRHLSGGCTRSLWCTKDTRSNAMEAGPQDTGLCIQGYEVYEVYEGYEGYKGRPDIFYKKLDTFLRGVQSVQGVRGIPDYFSENQTTFRWVYKVYKVYRGYKVHRLGS